MFGESLCAYSSIYTLIFTLACVRADRVNKNKKFYERSISLYIYVILDRIQKSNLTTHCYRCD